MNVKTWNVCVIEPNKFEGQIILDLLRNAGVDKVRLFNDQEGVQESLELINANVVIASFEMGPMDGAAWTRVFRRNRRLANRKASIFITSGAFSRAMAEECRHAGANALIGKPISSKILINTINKVLANPRPFIDAEGYVGPCRRAGIVTAGAPSKRRKADKPPTQEGFVADVATLQKAVDALAKVTRQFAADWKDQASCEAALKAVQAYAVSAGDGALMRACAAFALQLTSAKSLRPEAVKTALEACVEGVEQLAAAPAAEASGREVIAERVRQAVAKAAMQRAA